MSYTVKERILLCDSSLKDSTNIIVPLGWYETFVDSNCYMEPRPICALNDNCLNAEGGHSRIAFVDPHLYFGTNKDISTRMLATGGIQVPQT